VRIYDGAALALNLRAAMESDCLDSSRAQVSGCARSILDRRETMGESIADLKARIAELEGQLAA
jgi:hypothetical protein